MKFLKKDKPGMAKKQKVAIALDVARRAGANIPSVDRMNRMRQRAQTG